MSTPTEEPNSEPTGTNPAWDEALSVLPEEFHPLVTPHFQKWDEAANQRIESVNASLKDYESYKPFVEHGITSDEIEQGLRLMYEINNNPQNVYDALSNAYSFGKSSEATENESSSEETSPISEDPRIAELQNGVELVSKIVLADAQAKQAAQMDWELDQEFKQLQEKYGEFDEQYVTGMMLGGASGEEAVQAFVNLKNSLTPQSFAPNILGSTGSSGSGLPSNAIKVTDLSGKETRNLVAEMLARANQQD
ncbi:hypothetical protein [Streptomyces hebeiensis]